MGLLEIHHREREAIDLLVQGLRPKQVVRITGLPERRVWRFAQEIRGGSARVGQPKTEDGILRSCEGRRSASFFASVYLRLAGKLAFERVDAAGFLEAYRCYRRMMASPLLEGAAILAADDAYTVCHAIRSGIMQFERCATHQVNYLTMAPPHPRQGCPHCVLIARAAAAMVDDDRPAEQTPAIEEAVRDETGQDAPSEHPCAVVVEPADRAVRAAYQRTSPTSFCPDQRVSELAAPPASRSADARADINLLRPP